MKNTTIDTIRYQGHLIERLTEIGPRGGRVVSYRYGGEYWHPTIAQALRRAGEHLIAWDLR